MAARDHDQSTTAATPKSAAKERGPAEWGGGKCCVPMWIMGCPAGLCGEPANGPQLPRSILRCDNPPYCFGPCCPKHGGPKDGEPIFFHDGLTDEGYPMWCVVMPDFENLQESPAGFDGDPRRALANLEAAVASALRQDEVGAA